jgi:hypothetical protein
MSRSPTSAELSSTSCYPNTHSVWFTKAVVPFESVLQHPENSQVAGFWILFNGLLQNASKSHIFPNRSPFPSGFRHSKSSGKIPTPLVHQWLHLSTGWDGKTLARSRVSCQFRIKDWRPWKRKTMSFFQGDRIEL